MSESPILLAEELAQLARFDEHWRVTLAGDNRLLAQALAKRGYLDVLKRRVPLYRLTDLGASGDRAGGRINPTRVALLPRSGGAFL